MLEINGIELEFDLSDVDVMESYEEARTSVVETLNKASGTEIEKLRTICDETKNFFDAIFGQGIGVEVCGEKPNFIKHIDAFEVVIDDAIRQQKLFEDRVKSMNSKYSGNRAVRRANK